MKIFFILFYLIQLCINTCKEPTLLGFWKGEGNLEDSSSFLHNLKNIGVIGYDQGYHGFAFKFNGDSILYSTTNINLQTFTISFYTSNVDSSIGRYFTSCNNCTSNSIYLFNNDKDVNLNFRSCNFPYDHNFRPVINDNQWYNIIITKLNNIFTVYVNGDPKLSFTNSVNTFKSNDILTIGNLLSEISRWRLFNYYL
jgi:hypothetical protein